MKLYELWTYKKKLILLSLLLYNRQDVFMRCNLTVCRCSTAGGDTYHDADHDAIVSGRPRASYPRPDDGDPRDGGHAPPDVYTHDHGHARTGRHGYPAVCADSEGGMERPGYPHAYPQSNGTDPQSNGADPQSNGAGEHAATSAVRLGQDG